MYSFLMLPLLPVLVALACRYFWPHEICWKEWAVSAGIGAVLTLILIGSGFMYSTGDVEILNGKITSKEREHGHYEESYDCNCSTDSNGHRSCNTCYRDHYTVTWRANSTIGTFDIDHIDRTSRSVYNTPDPSRYTIINVGDPASRTHRFTNYVRAVDRSLFHFSVVDERYINMLPQYPSNIYDIYKIDRVIPVGVNVPDLRQWNDDLSNMLKDLGPTKQVNASIVFVNADQAYLESLRTHWLNGKQNDVVVVVGTKEYPNIDWVGVLSWSDNELFKIELRDAVYVLKTIDRSTMLQTVHQHVAKSFTRKHFEDFDYLKYDVDPPEWSIVLSLLLGIASALGMSYYSYRNRLF
jgi:hypothetical protein